MVISVILGINPGLELLFEVGACYYGGGDGMK